MFLRNSMGSIRFLWWIIKIDVFRIIWPELAEVDAAEKAIVVELSEKVDQSSHQHRQQVSVFSLFSDISVFSIRFGWCYIHQRRCSY
ncbi:unnamed protein product [Brassica rapa subsp. trilocularis]